MPLLIAFLLLPIVEIWLLIEIGGEIGAGATIAWIILSAVIGGFLLRNQGAQATARLRAALVTPTWTVVAVAAVFFEWL